MAFLELVLFLIAVICIFRVVSQNKELSLLFLWLIILPIFVQTISLWYINTGTYVSELNIISYNNNSLFYFEIIVVLFLTSLIVILKYQKKEYSSYYQNITMIEGKKNSRPIIVGNYFVAAIFLLLAYLFIDLAFHGIPLFNRGYGLKMNYFTVTKHFPLISSVYSIVCLYSPGVLGYLLVLNSKRLRKKIFLLITFMIIYSYLIGFKVSGINIILLFTFIPYSIKYFSSRQIKYRINRNTFIYIFLGIVAVIGGYSLIITNYKYTSTGNTDVESLQKMFIQRAFGLSNHLFWASKNYLASHPINFNVAMGNLLKELSAIFIQPSISNTAYGVSKLMNDLGDPSIVKWYLQNQTRMGASAFTVCYFNCGILLTFGWAIVLAMLLSKLVKTYLKALARENIIEILIASKILYAFYSFLWNSGSIGDFLTVPNILAILVIFILQEYAPLRFRFSGIRFKH